MDVRPPEPLKLFICYSHKNEGLRDDIVTCLQPLKRRGLISAWWDGKISPGTEWARDIVEKLDAADIILLLISRHFLASDFIQEVELKRAMERHSDGKACLIPVILSDCDWQIESFGKLQVLPKDGVPITSTSWGHIEQAFADFARGIRKAVEELREKSALTSGTSRKINGTASTDSEATKKSATKA